MWTLIIMWFTLAWKTQHPNTGPNIQQLYMGLFGGAKRLNFELLENAKFFTPNGKYCEKL